jgi:hypothetical protein
MNPIARRLLVAAVRKLLPDAVPDAVPDNPGSALALRPSDRGIVDRRSADDFFPTARPVQTLYVPPSAPVAAPDLAPRRRRKVVTETVTYEESEW